MFSFLLVTHLHILYSVIKDFSQSHDFFFLFLTDVYTGVSVKDGHIL